MAVKLGNRASSVPVRNRGLNLSKLQETVGIGASLIGAAKVKSDRHLSKIDQTRNDVSI